METVHSLLTTLLLATFYSRPVLAFDIFLNYQQRKSWHFHQLLLTYCFFLKFIKVSHMFGGKCYLITAAMNLGQGNISEACAKNSVHRGRVVVAGDMYSRGCAWWGPCMVGGGVHDRGACMVGGV